MSVSPWWAAGQLTEPAPFNLTTERRGAYAARRLEHQTMDEAGSS